MNGVKKTSVVVKHKHFKGLALHPNDPRLWPNAEVPYELAAYFTPQEQGIINYAMDAFRKHTCIKFRERTARDMYYLAIFRKPNAWCYCTVGRDFYHRTYEGKFFSELNMDPACFTASNMIHELMHGIGFHHEQQREDRDPLVTAGPRDPNPGRDYWNRHTYTRAEAYYMGEYDPESIMHYPFPYFKPHPRTYFTQSDVNNINTLYNCPMNENSTIQETDARNSDTIWNMGSISGRNVIGTNTNCGCRGMNAARRTAFRLSPSSLTRRKANPRITKNTPGRNDRRANNRDTTFTNAPRMSRNDERRNARLSFNSPTRRRNDLRITSNTGRNVMQVNDMDNAFTNAPRMSDGNDEKGSSSMSPHRSTRRSDDPRITRDAPGKNDGRTNSRNTVLSPRMSSRNGQNRKAKLSRDSFVRRANAVQMNIKNATFADAPRSGRNDEKRNAKFSSSDPTRRYAWNNAIEKNKGKRRRNDFRITSNGSNVMQMNNIDRAFTNAPMMSGRNNEKRNPSLSPNRPSRRYGRRDIRITRNTPGRNDRRTSNRNFLWNYASTRRQAVRLDHKSPTGRNYSLNDATRKNTAFRRDDTRVTRSNFGRNDRRTRNTIFPWNYASTKKAVRLNHKMSTRRNYSLNNAIRKNAAFRKDDTRITRSTSGRSAMPWIKAFRENAKRHLVRRANSPTGNNFALGKNKGAKNSANRIPIMRTSNGPSRQNVARHAADMRSTRNTPWRNAPSTSVFRGNGRFAASSSFIRRTPNGSSRQNFAYNASKKNTAFFRRDDTRITTRTSGRNDRRTSNRNFPWNYATTRRGAIKLNHKNPTRRHYSPYNATKKNTAFRRDKTRVNTGRIVMPWAKASRGNARGRAIRRTNSPTRNNFALGTNKASGSNRSRMNIRITAGKNTMPWTKASGGNVKRAANKNPFKRIPNGPSRQNLARSASVTRRNTQNTSGRNVLTRIKPFRGNVRSAPREYKRSASNNTPGKSAVMVHSSAAKGSPSIRNGRRMSATRRSARRL